MSWGNFTSEEENPQGQNQEPKKLIQSVSVLDTLTDRTNELTSKLLSDIDRDTGLTKQISSINISKINKEASKDTVYKTEEDRLEAYKNFILNHENDDLFKSVTNYSVSIERKRRYDIYEQIMDSNYIAFRILKAFINNILIKNAQTKTFLTIKTPEDKDELLTYLGREIKNSYDKFNRSILIKYKLQRKLKEVIVPKTLLYGNYFAEIIDLNRLNNIADYEQILLESETETQPKKKKNEKEKLNFIFESNFDCYKDEEELLKSLQNREDNKSIEEAAYNQNIKKRETNLKEALNSKILQEHGISDVAGLFHKEKELTEAYHQLVNAGVITESDMNFGSNELYNEIQKVKGIINDHSSNPNGIDNIIEESILESGIDAYDSHFFDSLGIKQSQTNKDRYNLEDISKLNFDCLKNIFVDYVHPRNVIIIEKDSMVYGYLVVEDESEKSGEYAIDRFQRLTTGLTTQGSIVNPSKKDQDTIKMTEELTNEIMKKITHNIKLSKSRLYAGNFDYFKTLNLGEEATVSLKLLIYNKIKSKSKLKFRFLTPDSLINFNTNVDKFAPYGTSVFDTLIAPVKLYTLALMASVVSRLSRAAVIRKWTIEAGGDRRDHKEIVDATKAELKSKAITYDKINTMKNISEIITDFRDMATISINGQRYIDMEILPMQDRGLPLNDLNDLRQDIIAAGGVPSIYLNITDNIDLRETLVHLNVTFATDIIDKQQNLEDGLNSLTSAIFKKVLHYNNYENSDFELSNYNEIKLNPPLVLQIQSDEAMITTVSNIIGLLENAKFATNPKGILKKYIPSINWDLLEKEGTAYTKALGKKAIAAGDTGGY